MSEGLTLPKGGAWLDKQTFPPLAWAVPGLIPEGLGILAAPVKAGKSWLVLATALAVAAGEPLLGVQVKQRPVFYLALEDSQRRLQNRCRTLLGDTPIPPEFYFDIDDGIALKQAEQFAERHSDGLVMIDTLQCVRPQKKAHDPYGSDYEFCRYLKKIAPKQGSLLMVHHTRKATDSQDFVDDVSGTAGIAGAADYVLVLVRQRLHNDAVLQVTGRDVDEEQYALRFDAGRWHPDGGDLQAAAERAELQGLGDTKRAVLSLVNSLPATSAAIVSERLGISLDSANQNLSRLCNEGRIARKSRGIYTSVSLSGTGNNSSSEGVNDPDSDPDNPDDDCQLSGTLAGVIPLNAHKNLTS